MKIFSNLPREEQNTIRLNYKKTNPKSYRYSINLYIIYTLTGLISLASIILSYFKPLIGISLFIISFISLLYILRLLNKSNQKFKDYLASLNIQYKK